MLYLVRHAKAGVADRLGGRRRAAPADQGRRAAGHAIARRLAKRDSTTLISSPYLRCVQTLEPLAHLLSEPVHTDDRFGGFLDPRA